MPNRFTIYVWPGFESWMAEHDNAVGTRSAADWIQFEADEMNRLFFISRSDVAPEGVLLRVGIDRIVRVPEETPYGGGHVPPEPCPTDSCWSFGGPAQHPDLLGWLESVGGQRDQVTMHEWGHQIGLLDVYNMDVQDFEVLITDEPEATTFSNSSAGNGIGLLFDGSTAGTIATYESRPVWFAVEFSTPRRLDRMTMRFDGYVHKWQVVSSDALESAIAIDPAAGGCSLSPHDSHHDHPPHSRRWLRHYRELSTRRASDGAFTPRLRRSGLRHGRRRRAHRRGDRLVRRSPLDQSQRKSVAVHVGFRVENMADDPLTLDPERVTLHFEHDGRIIELAQADRVEGARTIPPGEEGQLSLHFVVPEGVSPHDVDAFRIDWKATAGVLTYSQRTPFLEYDPDPLYRTYVTVGYYYSPYFDPFLFQPFIYHHRLIVHTQPFVHGRYLHVRRYRPERPRRR